MRSEPLSKINTLREKPRGTSDDTLFVRKSRLSADNSRGDKLVKTNV